MESNPCINCITFPICKSKFNSIVAEDRSTIYYSLAIIQLEKKCSILASYLKDQQVSVDEHRLESIHDLYIKDY